LLRLFGAKLGRHVHVQASVKIWAPWNLEVGNFVGIGDNVTIYSMAGVRIDDYAVVSQGTHLCAGTHDFNAPNFQLMSSPIRVGARVWLCAETFVGPGVSIAEGSVIAARGVVCKSIVTPWRVWGGVPVREIGARNKERVLG
jgi:putative colanic acid biosynthesis acetyltransferase WcaF